MCDAQRLQTLLRLWQRPALEEGVDARRTLQLQLLDVRAKSSRPPAWFRSNGEAVLQLYGVTEDEHSVLVHVHGFQPYFYVQAWNGVNGEQIEHLRASLNRLMDQDACVRAELVNRQSVWGYSNRPPQNNFIRLTMMLPNQITPARRLLEEGISVDGVSVQFEAYEAKLPFPLRFMIDRDIVGGGWISIDEGRYRLRNQKERTSRCQIELDVSFEHVKGLPVDQFLAMAPLRVFSFDIECAARKNTFPEPEFDPVIQIAITQHAHGRERSERDVHCVLSLRSCSPIAGASVICFESERELLHAFQQILCAADPDVLTGYNIVNFDFPYLLDRARHLKLHAFGYLGRTINEATQMKDTTFSSKAYGTRESKDISIDGRVQLDIIQVMHRDYKLRSYSLNSVSAHFLKQQKEDVHHSIITDLFNGSAETRQRLAVYCLKDAVLPVRLMQTLLILVNYVEMARVTGVPISYLLSRGQQIKVLSQLYRKTRACDLVVPNRPRESEQTYEGATVLEPLKGYYADPIATLDFSSLYPSIMMAHNLCYSTLVHPSDVASLDPSTFVRTPTGDVFVKSAVKSGLLPEILQELLAARKRAKKDMAAATDPLTKDVLNGRQLALKISANSVYGFTGAIVGQLPCVAISSSVTSFGRQMIEQTKSIVESEFCIAKGYKHDAVVIYGDTDSVMIKFGMKEVAETMELAKKAADVVSATFQKPIRLEFEKVYFPYLLMNKKRYAGLYWTNPNSWDKMDCKGIETVRRDNCDLVKTVVQTCLQKILIDRDVEGALQFTKNIISELLYNRIDMSQLVITKQLSKDPAQMQNRMAHSELAIRMSKRDPVTAPSVGDRVAYVIVRGSKGAKAYEKAEDPIFVLEHDIPIDTQYYLEHQLKLPLERLFEPILGNTKSLLSGDHTRRKKVSTSNVGGLMRFAVKRQKCLGCKVPLDKSERAVCQHCKHRLPDIYTHHLDEFRDNEQLFNRLWTQCQRCQGSLLQDVICSSRDCPIFYRRKKVQKDLASNQKILERLEF